MVIEAAFGVGRGCATRRRNRGIVQGSGRRRSRGRASAAQKASSKRRSYNPLFALAMGAGGYGIGREQPVAQVRLGPASREHGSEGQVHLVGNVG